MKVAIVFESMFGNTQALCGDVMAGLVDAGAEVTMSEVGDTVVRDLARYDLVVLAAPTHALALSRPQSRSEAVDKGADPAHATTGLREWLGGLDVPGATTTQRPAFAVFDTRISQVRHWPGSAAHQTSRILHKQGYTVVDTTSFYVVGIKGPIDVGERSAAREWGRALTGLTQPSGSVQRHR